MQLVIIVILFKSCVGLTSSLYRYVSVAHGYIGHRHIKTYTVFIPNIFVRTASPTLTFSFSWMPFTSVILYFGSTLLVTKIFPSCS